MIDKRFTIQGKTGTSQQDGKGNAVLNVFGTWVGFPNEKAADQFIERLCYLCTDVPQPTKDGDTETLTKDKTQIVLWYLATPYTKYQKGVDAAWQLACREASRLLLAGVPVYSPIAETHPIAVIGGMNVQKSRFWADICQTHISLCTGIIVVMADSWLTSVGVSAEIKSFRAAGKPVVFMEPGKLPNQLLQTVNRRTPTDGQPYYCVTCGVGYAEYGACEAVYCQLEHPEVARSRLDDNTR